MPLFGGRRGDDDARPRELALANEPIVTADSFLVLVDLVVRYDHAPQQDGGVLGWNPDAEVAISAVAVATLRVEGERAGRDEVLADRARFADPLARALELAPVPAGFRPTVVSLEVRPHDPDARRRSEFRVVGT